MPKSSTKKVAKQPKTKTHASKSPELSHVQHVNGKLHVRFTDGSERAYRPEDIDPYNHKHLVLATANIFDNKLKVLVGAHAIDLTAKELLNGHDSKQAQTLTLDQVEKLFRLQNNFGPWLKKMQKKRGNSNRDLQKGINTSGMYIAEYRTNKRRPTFASMLKILQFFKTPLNKLP